MTHRVNVMLDDQVWDQLQAIPAGERSRFINDVVSQELLKQRQRDAWQNLQTLRQTLPVVPGCSEDWVREDRDAHS